MNRDAEAERDEVEHDRERSGNDVQLPQRDYDHGRAQERVYHAIEAELFRRDRELAVNRQDEERIEFPGPHEFGQPPCRRKLTGE